MARQRIALQELLHQEGQAVETAAHVGRLRAQVDAHRRRQAQHAGSSKRASNCRTTSGSKSAPTRSTRPLAHTTSTALDAVAVVLSFTTRTGTKAGVAV